ncbi:MAG: cobalamin-dependent protein [Candidatus Lokiarchaeota archaeon]|nr:cobalamin-dependent protein [Candidatus Lokiarchaeota archaeon]
MLLKNKQELFQELPAILKHYEIVIFGFSIFTEQIWLVSNIIENLRKKFGNRILIIAGGPHATGDPKGTLEKGFDVVFLSESEKSIIEFIKSQKKKSHLTILKELHI